VWKYKYVDEVLYGEADGTPIGRKGEMIKTRTAKHYPDWHVHIKYNKNLMTCYIYSDRKIEGLKLVAEDVKEGK